jgi:hypothetical protein
MIGTYPVIPWKPLSKMASRCSVFIVVPAHNELKPKSKSSSLKAKTTEEIRQEICELIT